MNSKNISKSFRIAVGCMVLCLCSYAAISQCTSGNTRFYFNSLDVRFSQPNATLTVSGLGCDPCVYPTTGGGQICECHQGCEAAADDYFQECIDNASNISEVIECYDNATILENNCKYECGELPDEIRTAVAYRQRAFMWWTTGWTAPDPSAVPPNFSYDSGTISGAPPETLVVPITGLPSASISYC